MTKSCPARRAGQHPINTNARIKRAMEIKMLTKTKAVDGAAIKKAIEGRDGKLLSSF